MNSNDFAEFCKLWAIANELSVNGKVLSEPAMNAIFEDLENYALEDINQALICHRKQNKYFPTTSDVVRILTALVDELDYIAMYGPSPFVSDMAKAILARSTSVYPVAGKRYEHH